MKCNKRPSYVASVFFAGLLLPSLGTLHAGEYPNSRTLAAAQTAKQQCVNTCRARYRDCRRQDQISPYECQGVYQDCVRYSCTGLGPG